MLHAISASVPIPFHRQQQAAPFAKQKLLLLLLLQKKKKKQMKAKVLIRSASVPAFPGQQAKESAENPDLKRSPNPSVTPSPSTPAKSSWRTFADGKWHRENESALSKMEPLPLPMTYPGSTPARKDVETMKSCDPEVKDCRDVIYQWTGECSRCQGTGEISYYKKKGREVICKCITCLGLGHVHKVTLRTDIDIVEEVDVAS